MNESEELQVLAIVTRRLAAAGLPCMLTGSMALNYYAVPRMTRDIDLVVDLSEPAADELVATFRDDFYVDADAVRQAIADHGSFNVIHTRWLVKVDIFVRKDTEYRRVEFGRRRRVSVGNQPFDIVAPEDLIVSKLDWARDTRSETQLDDARSLLRMVPDLDRRYLQHWVTRLGLDALYQELSR